MSFKRVQKQGLLPMIFITGQTTVLFLHHLVYIEITYAGMISNQ